jgi:regulatory protein
MENGAALTVGTEVCLRFGLRVGTELDASAIDAVKDAEARRLCLQSALRLLSYRPRSEAELRQRLTTAQRNPAVVPETIERLKHAGLVDDRQFAERWVEERNRRAPRSGRLIAQELRNHGVASQLIVGAASVVDERDAAYRAAERRARALAGSPFQQFQQRVGGLLLRRGFSYEVVHETVSALWKELDQETVPD